MDIGGHSQEAREDGLGSLPASASGQLRLVSQSSLSWALPGHRGKSLSRRPEPLQATCCCFELDKSTREASESEIDQDGLPLSLVLRPEERNSSASESR